MFIVNAQAIIQKNYSLATFEKLASMLTETAGVVLLRVRERGLGCLSVEKICILFLVGAIPSCQGGHPLCVFAYFYFFSSLLITLQASRSAAVVLAAIPHCMGCFRPWAKQGSDSQETPVSVLKSLSASQVPDMVRGGSTSPGSQ